MDDQLKGAIKAMLDEHTGQVRTALAESEKRINDSIIKANKSWREAFREHERKIAESTREALRILDVTRCQTILVHAAVHALLRTHQNRPALAAAFTESSDEMMKMIAATPDIHKDAVTYAAGIRKQMLDRISGIPVPPRQSH